MSSDEQAMRGLAGIVLGVLSFAIAVASSPQPSQIG